MESNEFIAEVYRRMSARETYDLEKGKFESQVSAYDRDWSEVENNPATLQIKHELRPVLPKDKNARILDIGFGNGYFIAACISLGYQHIEGAEFGASAKQKILNWSSSVKSIHDIKVDIGGLLKDQIEQYDFIHLSHVIEHIPKYSLFYNVDSIYQALTPGGKILLRTPNMHSPRPMSLLLCTLGHEYGFTVDNLGSLLELCNFDHINFLKLHRPKRFRGKKIINLFKAILFFWEKIMHRLFGADSRKKLYGAEIVVLAERLDRPPLFDPSTR